jgi:hypothetical protein
MSCKLEKMPTKNSSKFFSRTWRIFATLRLCVRLKWRRNEIWSITSVNLFPVSIYALILSTLFLFCTAANRKDMPKTVLFSPITPEVLRDTAADWKKTGFDGFLLAGIMSNWADDIWATDGDPGSRGTDDETAQRVKLCNDSCATHGITENFIKIAFYSHVPLWTCDQEWLQMNDNFQQAARFAAMSGCRGIALDIEYVSEQYDPAWDGYTYGNYSISDLRRAAQKRGHDLVQSMLAAFPDMVFLKLPEGITFYGPLATDFFIGMLQGMAEDKAQGGLFLLTERSYDMTTTLGLIHYAFELEQKIVEILDKEHLDYWSAHCGIALGGWPLGYYRKIFDKNGTFLGYSGREETFGQRVVGSYADKSARFSADDFRAQYAGLLLGSKRYCWIYGHGATWWQFSEAEVQQYGAVSNSALPVEKQLNAYKAVVRDKWPGTPNEQKMSQLLNRGKTAQFGEAMGFVTTFDVIGPFGCRDCSNFDTAFAPEQGMDRETSIDYNGQKLTWKAVVANPRTGYLDFLPLFTTTDWVCAYALCQFSSPRSGDAQIRLGTNDTATLWFNGQKILSKNVERAAALDSDILPIRLKKGVNHILIKVCNTELNWGLYLRVTDAEGALLHSLEFNI